jgi:peptide deformylase
MSLKVITLPDERLKKIAKKVSIVDDSLRSIMDEMVDIMKREDGIGLASIQVGVSESAIVIDLHHEHNEGCSHDHIEDEVPYPLFMVNPELIEKSEETEIEDEGCLSVPGMYVPVQRHKKIKVRYLDYYGKEQHIETDTFLARVIQHEMDHLRGVTMLNYLSPLKRQMALKKLEKMKKK